MMFFPYSVIYALLGDSHNSQRLGFSLLQAILTAFSVHGLYNDSESSYLSGRQPHTPIVPLKKYFFGLIRKAHHKNVVLKQSAYVDSINKNIICPL